MFGMHFAPQRDDKPFIISIHDSSFYRPIFSRNFVTLNYSDLQNILYGIFMVGSWKIKNSPNTVDAKQTHFGCNDFCEKQPFSKNKKTQDLIEQFLAEKISNETTGSFLRSRTLLIYWFSKSKISKQILKKKWKIFVV